MLIDSIYWEFKPLLDAIVLTPSAPLSLLGRQIKPTLADTDQNKLIGYDILHDKLADIEIILTLCVHAIASEVLSPHELGRGIDMARAKVEQMKRQCANQLTQNILIE